MDYCFTLNDLDIKPCVGETGLSYTSARESTVPFVIFFSIRNMTLLHYGQAKCDLADHVFARAANKFQERETFWNAEAF